MVHCGAVPILAAREALLTGEAFQLGEAVVAEVHALQARQRSELARAIDAIVCCDEDPQLSQLLHACQRLQVVCGQVQHLRRRRGSQKCSQEHNRKQIWLSLLQLLIPAPVQEPRSLVGTCPCVTIAHVLNLGEGAAPA